MINSAKVEILDDERLITQCVNLERRTARSGKDSIDHGPGGHDDVINAAAGSIVCCGVGRKKIINKAEIIYGAGGKAWF